MMFLNLAQATRQIYDHSDHITEDYSRLEELIKTLTTTHTQGLIATVMLLGAASGLVGGFMLLRKRSLIGDSLSHATFPGVCIAFVFVGKWLPGLLLGAAIFGLLGALTVGLISKKSILKDDTAMGIVLSVFFGLGLALMGVIQSIQNLPEKSGIMHFIYGKVALLTYDDRIAIFSVSIVVVIACIFLFKELKMLCFDENYAASMGWPVLLLDFVLLAMVTGVTVVGLQAVGLILIIAMLIIPPAAARFWTEKLWLMMVLSGVIGAIGAMIGALISGMENDMPAGAVMVLSMTGMFLISMFLGVRRGVFAQGIRHTRTFLYTARTHFLRAFYELNEKPGQFQGLPDSDHEYHELKANRDQLKRERSWSGFTLSLALFAAKAEGLIKVDDHGDFVLSKKAYIEAIRHVRNHRLWEIYLITHADIAPSHVDRDADMVEHVLGMDLVAKLEEQLKEVARTQAPDGLPSSPHQLG